MITRTLDVAYMSSGKPPCVHLMKIDVQGYEGQILKGFSKLRSSRSTNAGKFEVAIDWLVGQMSRKIGQSLCGDLGHLHSYNIAIDSSM